ncbi:MAG: hypothetical protein V1701_02690 [Planctomycetota bacterium]
MINAGKQIAIAETYLTMKKILGRFRIELALIGGWAVKFYANPMPTMDIDFLCGIGLMDIVQDRYGYAGLYEKMMDAGFDRLRLQDSGQMIKDGFLVIMGYIKNIRIDLFYADTRFRQIALSRAEIYKIANVPVKIIGIRDLITMKTISTRPKDEKHLSLLVPKAGLTSADRREIDCLAAQELEERGLL